MRRISRKLRRVTADLLDLPQDVVFDLPRVMMVGNTQLYVENHRGVLHFTDELLRLKLTKGELEVHGRQLVIRTIYPEELFVEGTVDQVIYKY